MDKSSWQTMGATLTIPDGWFVLEADFDADPPYIKIREDGPHAIIDNIEQVLVPKALAYYLSTHWCGSQSMRDLIREDATRKVRNEIKSALGL